MSIVILAPLSDQHANYIEYGLICAGYDVVRWEGIGWQQGMDATIEFGTDESVYLGHHRVTQNDTVWQRRQTTLTHHPKLDAGDYKYSRNENRAFYDTLLYHIERTGARCINNWSTARHMENKSIQLSLATAAGLVTPRTIMTNSKYSLETRGIQSAVHKSFCPHGWVDQQYQQASACEAIYIADLLSFEHDMFSSTPGIYQAAINKQHDVRVFMMGHEFYAYVIKTPQTELDCRAALAKAEAILSFTELPVDIREKLSRFSDLGHLSFGCFDFCVDSAGTWWFLEVNQAGQFLFIDDMLPEAGLYHHMLAFLVGASANDARFPPYCDAKEACAVHDSSTLITDETRYATLL
jgi:glutathione synthase/RimK-type ligase-like ATP-grasp enzyme